MARRRPWLLLLALALAGADQLSKLVAVRFLAGRPPLVIIEGLFDLHLSYNKGAAFSLLAGWSAGPWLLLALSVLAIVVTTTMLLMRLRSWAFHLALALICGGALGNLIDRLRLGLVVDFLHLYWRGWHWPTFNLADSALTAGGVLAGLVLLLERD